MNFSTLTYFENPFSVTISRKVMFHMENVKNELRKFGYLYYLTENSYIRSLIVDELIQLTHYLYVLIMDNSIPDFRLLHKRGYSFWKNPTLYKTTMCENWKSYGRCKFGKKCWYAHGNHELRQQIKFNNYFPFTNENLVYAALSQSGILINPIYERSIIQSKTLHNTSVVDNTPIKKHLANFPPLYPPGTIFWSEFCIRPLCSYDKLMYDERISKYEYNKDLYLNIVETHEDPNIREKMTPEKILNLIIKSKSMKNDNLAFFLPGNYFMKDITEKGYGSAPVYVFQHSNYIIPPFY